MQDFTKPFKMENEAKQLELNIPNQPKTGFIASRMNKDNFWNLVFFTVMFLWFIMKDIIEQRPLRDIICLGLIIGIMYLVKRNSNIVFDKLEHNSPIFIINGNKRINATGIGFVTLFVVSIPITAVITGAESNVTMSLVFWSVPVLYCILRNIPIAVYFKKEAWISDGTVPSSGNSRIRTSICYSWHPMNIFYKPK
jgi:hypothetical protein